MERELTKYEKEQLKEQYKQRLERIRTANEVLNKHVRKEIEQYGLVKGQKVAKHERRTSAGKPFVAGQGGTGSPDTVLAEGKTVSPGKIAKDAGSKTLGIQGDEVVSPAAIIDKDSIHNPDTMQTIIRNLENATQEKLQQMANDLFKQPRTRDRGVLAELMLKEILRRGLEDKSESEKKMEDISKQQRDVQVKQKENAVKEKEKEKATKEKKSAD